MPCAGKCPPAEFCLWQALSNHQCYGMRFLRHRVIGQFIPDFYCPAKKLGIGVDGSIHLLHDMVAPHSGTLVFRPPSKTASQTLRSEARAINRRVTERCEVGMQSREVKIENR